MHIRDIRGILFWTPVLLGGLGWAHSVMAQSIQVTQEQKNVAKVVSVQGVPASELAPGAPTEYKVKPGDTLWGLSSMFLKNPWRWPELWGMNLSTIQNPHLILPGQMLYLNKKDDQVTLSTSAPVPESTRNDLPVIKLSPQVRADELVNAAIPTLRLGNIAPFLVDPILVEDSNLDKAPRLVAFKEGRVIAAKGDRVYGVSGTSGAVTDTLKVGQTMRVVRDIRALKQPDSDEVLGYEAEYVGRVKVVKAESKEPPLGAPAGTPDDAVPASLDVIFSTQEIRLGDRLVPESPFESRSYTPKAPDTKVVARVVLIHGSVVANASQNQVLAINKGQRDGLVAGDVLSFLSAGARVTDKSANGGQPSLADMVATIQSGGMAMDKLLGTQPVIRLPNEQSGYAMVFRVFEKVAYVLVLEAPRPIKVGDYLVNPN